jgi:hypothetical protein
LSLASCADVVSEARPRPLTTSAQEARLSPEQSGKVEYELARGTTLIEIAVYLVGMLLFTAFYFIFDFAKFKQYIYIDSLKCTSSLPYIHEEKETNV